MRKAFNILHHANVGKQSQQASAETTPLRHPEHYQYDLNLPDIAEVWRRGSVVASWILDLTAIALTDDPKLTQFAGRVSDSGEGRWTILAAVDEAYTGASLEQRAVMLDFPRAARWTAHDKLLSAMRFQFGGHKEEPLGVKTTP